MHSTRVKALCPHRQHMHDYGSLLFWILTVGHRCRNRDQTLKAAMRWLTPTIPGFCSFTRLTSANPIEQAARQLALILKHKLRCTCQASQMVHTRIAGLFAVKGCLV